MLCVTPKIHGALGDSAVAESAPQTFALLPHLSKDPALQTGSCRCTPNSRLFIMHCHRNIPPPTIPLSSPRPPMLLLALHPSAAIRYQSTAMRLAGSGFFIIPNNAALPLPRCHTQAKMAGMPCGTDGRTDRQAGKTRGHVISV